MESSEPHGDTAEMDEQPVDARHAAGFLDRPALLARAARAVAEAPEDADGAALLAVVGRAVLPALGDIVALYAEDAAGALRFVAVTASDARLAQRLHDHHIQHPETANVYAEAVAPGRAAILSAASMTGAGASNGCLDWLAGCESVGIAGEIVAPLAAGSPPEAVLVVGVMNGERAPGAADLAATEVLAALIGSRCVVGKRVRREAALRAALDEALLAGRELAHTLNNHLTMPVGVVELLLDRSDLSPDLHEMLEAAAKDLATLEVRVRAFHSVMRARSVGQRTEREAGAGVRPGSPP